MVRGPAGGIRRLCDLIDEYGDELEADFAQFYDLDIADVWRGQLSPRRVLVLAGQLGTEPYSRFRAATLGGPEFVGWTREADVLADVFDAIVQNSIVTIKSAGGKARQPKETYPRPTPAQAEKSEAITSASIDDFPIHLVAALTSMK